MLVLVADSGGELHRVEVAVEKPHKGHYDIVLIIGDRAHMVEEEGLISDDNKGVGLWDDNPLANVEVVEVIVCIQAGVNGGEEEGGQVSKVDGRPHQCPPSNILDDGCADLATMDPGHKRDTAGVRCHDGQQGRCPKGKMYSEHLVVFFQQQHQQQGQQCQCSKMCSCFLLSGKTLMWQLMLVAAWGWEGGSSFCKTGVKDLEGACGEGREGVSLSATALRSAGPCPHQTQQQPSLGVERESITARIAHDQVSRIQEEDGANQAIIHREHCNDAPDPSERNPLRVAQIGASGSRTGGWGCIPRTQEEEPDSGVLQTGVPTGSKTKGCLRGAQVNQSLYNPAWELGQIQHCWVEIPRQGTESRNSGVVE
ncbi:hypothetical protein DFH08DRAFT_800181 [Mycena albidolilacea]|uniref:Uncharacterized protein n=1 Tax=Mycena albidolilacea TaxID=1033008 RepID=A0AAD7AJZ2_9AGAR|nr:hypothetical protein DFH08DRAFT_800181 [Mycena albidolilacea]